MQYLLITRWQTGGHTRHNDSHAASTPPRRGRHTSATSPHLCLLQHPLDEDPVAQGDELAQLGACLQRGDGGRRVSTPPNRGAAAARARHVGEDGTAQEGRQKRGGGVMGAHHPHRSLTPHHPPPPAGAAAATPQRRKGNRAPRFGSERVPNLDIFLFVPCTVLPPRCTHPLSLTHHSLTYPRAVTGE